MKKIVVVFLALALVVISMVLSTGIAQADTGFQVHAGHSGSEFISHTVTIPADQAAGGVDTAVTLSPALSY